MKNKFKILSEKKNVMFFKINKIKTFQSKNINSKLEQKDVSTINLYFIFIKIT